MRPGGRKWFKMLRAACLENLGLKLVALMLAVVAYVVVRRRAEEHPPRPNVCTHAPPCCPSH